MPKHLLLTMFYIPSTLNFTSEILQNNSAETMEPAGPLNQSPGSARPEPDVALEMLIMFVLFTNAAQSRFLIFWPFLFFSLRSIYTDPHSDINSQQRAFWSCHIQGTVCWKMSLRATVYGISVRAVMVVWACSFLFCLLGGKHSF